MGEGHANVQICVRYHEEKRGSSLFCNKNLGEIGESSDQLSESESYC